MEQIPAELPPFRFLGVINLLEIENNYRSTQPLIEALAHIFASFGS